MLRNLLEGSSRTAQPVEYSWQTTTPPLFRESLPLRLCTGFRRHPHQPATAAKSMLAVNGVADITTSTPSDPLSGWCLILTLNSTESLLWENNAHFWVWPRGGFHRQLDNEDPHLINTRVRGWVWLGSGSTLEGWAWLEEGSHWTCTCEGYSLGSVPYTLS